MKKILLICAIALMVSCSNIPRGIEEKGFSEGNIIDIHGKKYQFFTLISKEQHRVWILVPKDSSEKVPIALNYEVSEGKTTRTETVIKID